VVGASGQEGPTGQRPERGEAEPTRPETLEKEESRFCERLGRRTLRREELQGDAVILGGKEREPERSEKPKRARAPT